VKITAAVLVGEQRRFEISEVDLAPPRAGEVLVKIVASGLCASDMNVLDGKRELAPFPMVLGHEAAGIVVETGPDVRSVQEGDHVVVTIVPSCGTCAYCLSGRPNYCTTAASAMKTGNLMDGTSRLSRGGERLNHFLTVSSFADHAVVPEAGVVVVNRDVPLDQAALVSCAVLTGFGAVNNTARVARASRVAVFGCGGIGLNVIQAARIAGAERIVAVDVVGGKLELARKLGATDAVHAGEQDPVQAIQALVGGVDYAFEAAGRADTVSQAWSSLDVGGEAIVVGLMRRGATVTLDADHFVDEKCIRGCYFGSASVKRDVSRIIDLQLSGELLLDEIISSRISLDELDSGFELLRANDGARKVVVFD